MQANNKQEEEQIRVKMVQGAGNGDITKDVIQHYIGDLIETQIIGNGPWIVTGVESGIEYTIDRNGEVTRGDVAVVESEDIESKIGGNVLSQTGTVTIQDSLENYVRVPKGFKIASDSGENVEEGIVIEDMSGNQFVWVPVGKINKKKGETIEIILGRYDFLEDENHPKIVQEASNGYITTNMEHGIGVVKGLKEFFEFESDAESQSVKGSTFGNSIAKDLKDFINSVNTNGGYYIGRYEARKGNDNNIIIKSGVEVWNQISQPDASRICRDMYSAGSGVKSDLVNSYAWDTSVVFREACGSKEETALCEGECCNIMYYGEGQTRNEWTTETGWYTGFSNVFRGRGLEEKDYGIGLRMYIENNHSDQWIGFRPILYL